MVMDILNEQWEVWPYFEAKEVKGHFWLVWFVLFWLVCFVLVWFDLVLLLCYFLFFVTLIHVLR